MLCVHPVVVLDTAGIEMDYVFFNKSTGMGFEYGSSIPASLQHESRGLVLLLKRVRDRSGLNGSCTPPEEEHEPISAV